MDKFIYLGSILSRAVHINDEVNTRTAKSSTAGDILRGHFWDRRGIRTDTKLKVYNAVILLTLLYAYEIWSVYKGHAKQRKHFHSSCLKNKKQTIEGGEVA